MPHRCLGCFADTVHRPDGALCQGCLWAVGAVALQGKGSDQHPVPPEWQEMAALLLSAEIIARRFGYRTAEAFLEERAPRRR